MAITIRQKGRLLSISSGWDGIMVHLRTPDAEVAIVLSDEQADALCEGLCAMLDEREETGTRA